MQPEPTVPDAVLIAIVTIMALAVLIRDLKK